MGNDPIIISIWNRSTGNAPDSFLGLYTFESHLLKKLALHENIEWFPLGKRSKRSHVRGSICISASFINESCYTSPNDDNQMMCIPFDPLNSFRKLYMRCATHDIINSMQSSPGESCLSDSSKSILNEIASVWRIRPPFQAMWYVR